MLAVCLRDHPDRVYHSAVAGMMPFELIGPDPRIEERLVRACITALATGFVAGVIVSGVLWWAIAWGAML
jgi:hypothetical protein